MYNVREQQQQNGSSRPPSPFGIGVEDYNGDQDKTQYRLVLCTCRASCDCSVEKCCSIPRINGGDKTRVERAQTDNAWCKPFLINDENREKWKIAEVRMEVIIFTEV